jgi:hypothetical protein
MLVLMLKSLLSMTMIDKDPSQSDGPERPEIDHLDLLLAMDFLHEFYDKALADDAAAMDHQMSVLSNAVKLEKRPFLQLCVPGEANAPMFAKYEQMVLRPERGTTASNKVRQIVARFPFFSDEEQPFVLPPGVTRWNDVSLEMNFRNGTSSRYWLNSKGLFAYDDAEALDFDYVRSPDTTDLYVVQDQSQAESAPLVLGIELLVLLRQSQAIGQANNPEDQ